MISPMKTHLARIAVLLAASIYQGPSASAAVQEPPGQVVFRDEFTTGLGEGWSFEREERAAWRTGLLGLEVRVQPGNMWGPANNAKNVLVHPIPSPEAAPVEISVTYSNRPSAQWEQANLVWFYDGGNMVKLGQELVTGRLSIVMGREQNDQARTVAIVPLDDYRVELRLQAMGNRVRGQFRTGPWTDWRDVGECDLPVKGEPKASLHFYNGSATEEHWVRVQPFVVRRLDVPIANWARERIGEKAIRGTDQPRRSSDSLALREGFTLFDDATCLAGEAKAEFDQSIFQHRDGSFAWRWNRRSSSIKQPTVLGVGVGNVPGASGTVPSPDGFVPTDVAALKALAVELNAVTRLENDQGDHNLALVLPMEPAGRISIWFDWYGPASGVVTVNDGHRDYGFVAEESKQGNFSYRISGLRGAPPRVNLLPFIQDALKRGLSASKLGGVSLVNEVWDGSRGGTLVTRFDVLMDGKRLTACPTPGVP